jgi:hypothetical protein
MLTEERDLPPQHATATARAKHMAVHPSFASALILEFLLLAGQMTNPLWAQERGKLPASTEPLPPYPSESNITFEWNYSCENARVCAFNCPGAGGSNNVKELTIYLGTISVGANQQSAIFYEFSTPQFSRANGFSISAGLSVLACQVNGMVLDYSGPPKRAPSSNEAPPKGESPPN